MDQTPSVAFRLIGAFFKWEPLIFAFGILMPLVAQTLVALEAPLPAGMHSLWVGFAVATLWGGLAQWKGRWI